jgi:PKD repeat protein
VAWDFSCGDSRNQPVISTIGNFPSAIPGSTGLDFMEENGNFICFTVRSMGLMRLEFGNSLSNTPQITSLGDLGVIGSGTLDLKLIKEGGNYFALINFSSGNMVRVAFGNSLLNTPTGSLITLPSNLFAFPFNMDLERMGNNVVAIVANISGQNVTIIDFGTSITNNSPSAFTIPVPGASPIAPTLVNDCGDLHAFVGYFSGAAMTRISFGNTVTQTPAQVSNFTVNSLWAYRQISMINDGLEWIMFATTSGGDKTHIYRFGNTITNLAPTITYPIDGGSQDFLSSEYKVINSTLNGVACNASNGDLKLIQFPELSTCNPRFSANNQNSLVFNNNGYYYISLWVTDTSSSTTSRFTDSIFVTSAPQSSFTASPGCLNTPVFFESTSSPDAVNFNWNFGDGNSSADENPEHQFDQPGPFTVTLTASNSFGCASTFSDSISVNQQPIALFTFNNNACAGTELGLSDQSTTINGNITNWTWLIGSSDTLYGSQPSFTLLNDGQFPITLVVEASTGCADTSSGICNVIPGPITDFTVQNTCLGDSVHFLNTTFVAGGLNTSYLWQFSNQDSSTSINPSWQFAAGDHPVKLTAVSSNGCTDTITSLIHVGPPAQVDFSIDDDTVCTAAPIQFSDSSLIFPGEIVIERIWDFGDSTPTANTQNTGHSYSSPGIYTVTLSIRTASNCLSSISKPITVISSPAADFNFTGTCEDAVISFNDSSTAAAGIQLANWLWNFDTLGFSNNQFPQFTFNEVGSYNIQLEVMDNNGCTGSTTIPINIQPRPIAGFSNSIPCSNQAISFTNTSTLSNGTITTWEWNFGDGSQNSFLQQPSHAYNATGAYPVTLITGSSYGCTDTANILVVVAPSPQFSLNQPKTCFGDLTSFAFNLISGQVSNPAHLWNFGDSTFSVQSQPTHLYNYPGTRTATLILTDLDNGCTWTDSTESIVFSNPIANFTSSIACENDTIILSDNSTGSANDTIRVWTWASPLFNTVNGPTVSLAGLSAGTYPVSLVVESQFGCIASTNGTFTIFNRPQVEFSADPFYGSPPLSVQFNNLSSTGQYFWNFGDGTSISTAQSPAHTFHDTGTFQVNLIVIDSLGCIDSIRNSIIVLEPFVDLALNQVLVTENNNEFTIKTRIRNDGNVSVSSFKIRVELNTKSPVTETVDNIQIEPGEYFNHTLGITFPVDESSPAFACSEILEVNGSNDDRISNNRKCNPLTSTAELLTSYPNPATSQLNLPLALDEASRVILETYNMLGQKAMPDISSFLAKGLNILELDISNLSDGAYRIRILAGNKEFKTGFVKRQKP